MQQRGQTTEWELIIFGADSQKTDKFINSFFRTIEQLMALINITSRCHGTK